MIEEFCAACVPVDPNVTVELLPPLHVFSETQLIDKYGLRLTFTELSFDGEGMTITSALEKEEGTDSQVHLRRDKPILINGFKLSNQSRVLSSVSAAKGASTMTFTIGWEELESIGVAPQDVYEIQIPYELLYKVNNGLYKSEAFDPCVITAQDAQG